MPRLSIQLQDDARTVVVGQRLRGSVGVDCADGGGRCDGLSIHAEWRTTGHGTVQTGKGEPAALFVGEWRAGERPSYAFDLPALEGPLTYHGTEVSLDWRLIATADIPWAADPTAELPLVLARGDVAPGDVRQDLAPPPVVLALGDDDLPTKGLVVLGAFLLIFVVAGLAAAIGGGQSIAAGDPLGVLPLAFGLVFAAAPVFILYMVVRNRLAASRLGPVEVKLVPDRVGPGEIARVRVSFRPRVDLQLNALTVTFTGFERAVRGSGRSKTVHVHRLHSHEERLLERSRALQGETVALEAALHVPADAAASLALGSNEVTWSVCVHIDVARWPDWSLDLPLVVLPR